MYKAPVLRALRPAARLFRPRLVHTHAASAPHVQSAQTPRLYSSASSASAIHDALADGTFVSRASAFKIPPAEPWRRHVSADPETTPTVYTFFEKATSTWQYIVVDPKTSEAVLVDPVLDYDPNSGSISTDTADGLVSFIEQNKLRVTRIL